MGKTIPRIVQNIIRLNTPFLVSIIGDDYRAKNKKQENLQNSPAFPNSKVVP